MEFAQSPWNSPGQNTGVAHCRQILYHLSHKGNPRILEWVAYPFSRGSFQPRNRTEVSCIAGSFLTNWAIREESIGKYCYDSGEGTDFFNDRKSISHKEKVWSNCLIKKINSHAKRQEKIRKIRTDFAIQVMTKCWFWIIRNFCLKRQTQQEYGKNSTTRQVFPKEETFMVNKYTKIFSLFHMSDQICTWNSNEMPWHTSV